MWANVLEGDKNIGAHFFSALFSVWGGNSLLQGSRGGSSRSTEMKFLSRMTRGEFILSISVAHLGAHIRKMKGCMQGNDF